MRDRPKHLLDLMRVRDGATVEELARESHLTRTTVVNHLRLLMSEGLVTRSGLRRGSRRPSVVYKLTENADRVFPQMYEEFLGDVLDELDSHARTGIKQVVSGVSKRWIARDLPALKGARGAQRIREALSVLSKRGFMPALKGPPSQRVLTQHNCPLRHLCARYPEVPEAIRRWMQALTGVALTRAACMAKGDASCAYDLGRQAR